MIQKYSPKNIITKVEWNALENKIKKKKALDKLWKIIIKM